MLKNEIQEPAVKTVSLKMPYPLYRKMRRVLAEQDATMSEILRGLAAQYVMEHEGDDEI